MNKKTGNFKQNSQLKSLQKKPQSVRHFEQPLVQKSRSKNSQLMPFKKVAVGLRKQGTLGAKSDNSWVRRKLCAKHLSSRLAQMHSSEHYRVPSQWFGNKGKGHCITEPQPPPPPHTQWFWEQVRGKGNFVLFSGLSQQWNRYSLRWHHNWSFQQHLTSLHR